jgi:hypothetical protein
MENLLKMKKTKKPKHVMLSVENFEKLRHYGLACETIDDCITKILAKQSGVYSIDET